MLLNFAAAIQCYFCTGNKTTCGDDNWVKDTSPAPVENCNGSSSHMNCYVSKHLLMSVSFFGKSRAFVKKKGSKFNVSEATESEGKWGG